MSTRRFKPLGLGKERSNKPPELSARDKLSSSFIRALEADWAEHGAATIERLRIDNPAKYSELIGRLVPLEINPPASPYAEAKGTRDVARVVLLQQGVPEWCIDDAMVDRANAALRRLSDELAAIQASVEN